MSMLEPLSPALKAVVSKEFWTHWNMDVTISIATSLSELLRTAAPAAPYNDKQ